MLIIFLRTVVFYAILTAVMRLMGKRQIGQLQLPEFSAAILLSELAALPITDRDIPLTHGLTALLGLGCLEVLLAFLCRKSPLARRILDGEPVLLVANGILLERNLTRARITPEEVFAQIRLDGYKDIGDVLYAVLEQTGAISILPKAACDQVTPSDLSVRTDEKGLTHPVVIDGRLDKAFLTAAHKTPQDILAELKRKHILLDDVLYMTCDDTGSYVIVRKRGDSE